MKLPKLLKVNFIHFFKFTFKKKSNLMKTISFLVANKKRAPPNFSWLETYHPTETEPDPDSEPTAASTINEVESSTNNCHDGLPAHLNQKADSAVSSPDVTVHRSSIATGLVNWICVYIVYY